MISNTSAGLFILVLVAIALFTIWSIFNRKRMTLLHKLYLFLMLDYSIWNITMLGMWLTPPERVDILQLLDSFTYLGIGVPSIYLMISIVFAFNYERFQKWMLLFLIIPVLSCFVCLTNNFHHLQYRVFSIVRSEIVFGPYIIVTGLHSYMCFLASFYLLIRFAQRNPSRLYAMQCSMLVLGVCAR